METLISIIAFITYGLVIIAHSFAVFILLPWAIYKYMIAPFIVLFRKSGRGSQGERN